MDNQFLHHKKMLGTIEYSKDDKLYRGKLIIPNDTIPFDGGNLEELTKAFKETVERFLSNEKQVTLSKGENCETETWRLDWYTCYNCGHQDIIEGFNFCPMCGSTIKWMEKDIDLEKNN